MRFPRATHLIVTGATREILTEEIKPAIENFLKERGLELSQEKTRITHIEEGFDFLGWNFRKYSGKMLIKPAAKNIKNFLAEIRKVIKDNKTAKQEDIIHLLNPKIRGWANYHQPVIAKETLNKVDNEIWKALWQWAKRRHPGKGKSWIKNRYFGRTKERNWVFKIDTNDKSQTLTLIKASDTKIQRHTKIKADANPFDKRWELYFEERLVKRMKKTPRGNKLLLGLWMKQIGICPICKTTVDLDKDEHATHHILPRCEGGKDIITNLLLLHGNCHRQVHSQDSTVLKLATNENVA
ncbi:MAG: hypothetical protein DDT32_01857 [Syntrophomonadaceae bacterium]|nr:hypothetical protein [Bacillota bacterium]